ncbi:MAG: glutathione S-transferase family protein [Synechococcaceae cyanobacterium RL_1_2]|nr:glutathione S-transferase family protein [Synechococcaceae cyanobacterium RL_1_2]
MIQLYQFELSQFSEKVRFILDYKGLEYKKVEVTPGVGQIEVFQLSGQRQVPIIKDGDTIVADSTEIALYLDRKYPDKPIIPSDPLLKGQCLIMEEWADESIGLKGRTAFLGAVNKYQNFRTSILPKNIPPFFKSLVGAFPGEIFEAVGKGLGLDAVKDARRSLEQNLEAICLILQEKPYLITDTPTLADFAVASLSMLIKFPEGDYIDVPEELKGKGIPGLADNSDYETFFTWRDKLYADYRKSGPSSPSMNKENNGSKPTTIQID